MLWWILATVCAFFVKGLCGFANTLVFTTMLSFGHSNVNISPVELLLGYPTNAILAWKERKSIRWRVCLPLAAMVVLGMIPGTLLLKNADVGLVKMIFGVVIMLVGLEMLLRRPGAQARKSRLWMSVIGVLSGILCGLYGVGALLGAYVSRVTEDSRGFKANICLVFLVENTLRVILYAAWGIITLDVVKQAAMLLPLMLLGLMLGMLTGRKLKEQLVKKIVMVMLVVSGAALVISNL